MSEKESVRCSVLVVNYNGGSMVLDCVRTALASLIRVEVLVWDNASADGSPDVLAETFEREPLFSLSRSQENIGFAAGVNRLLSNASGETVLLLNPDCLVEPETIDKVMQVLEKNPKAGMAGCLICNPDGSEQAGCRRQVPTPWRSLVRVLHLDKVITGHPRFKGLSLNTTPLPDKPVEVEAISGAFMLVTRAALHDVGPLDDHYFMHCEDLDWCMRFRQKGWQILFVPNALA
ncbi:MAG: glycosyltransferase family 2 protein, partial [Desulfotignum sp.]|nr:glycosyltransferase family 2 protein [Desulfotignum sp.]